MPAVTSLSEGQVEALARLLGDFGTGSDITRILRERGITDQSNESTKWRRLHWVFSDLQGKYFCANKVLDFIKAFLAPARFIGRSDEFNIILQQLNAILSFSGLEYREDGSFYKSEAIRTLSEAERRVQIIRNKFRDRSLHPEVYKYCNKELMSMNYFHAVFEATKGLAQRIRDLSGVKADGSDLIDQVFSINRPILVFNTLQTETEKSEHKGFATLLKGCFGAIRNPLAHEPKILWSGEDDAADYLSLISLLHRKLDNCISIKTFAPHIEIHAN